MRKSATLEVFSYPWRVAKCREGTCTLHSVKDQAVMNALLQQCREDIKQQEPLAAVTSRIINSCARSERGAA